MLGALICLADMMQVFVLNMTYDFGLKQISFHLILMSLFLLAPDSGVSPTSFSWTAPRDLPSHPPLFRARSGNRSRSRADPFAVYLVGMFTRLALNYWYAGGRRKPEVGALRHLGRGAALD